MKKVIASIFVAVLVFLSFDTQSAMAVGNSHADVFEKGNGLYTTIHVSKALHNNPADPAVVNYVGPVQDVKVIRARYLINTWKGHKWVGWEAKKYWVPAGGGDTEWNTIRDFNASNATLKVPQGTRIYDTYEKVYSVGSLDAQTVQVRQAWYKVETWLGPKYIGYQLR